MSWHVSPWVYPVWDSLRLLNLIDYFLFHVGEIFNYNLFKNFLIPFLFLFFIWDSYNLNVGAFDIVPEVCETILRFFSTFLCYSDLQKLFPPLYLPAHWFILLLQIFCYWFLLEHSCLENLMGRGAWWAAVHGVAKIRKRLSNFTFTFHFHALEKEMATHSSVLAWRIPGTGEAWWAAIYGVTQGQTRLKWLSSSSRRRRREKERVWENFEEIIVENFPNMEKEIVNQVQEAERVPCRRNPRRNTPRHILIKLTKTKHRKE